MNTRNFILLLVLLSALTSFADKKMTICNDDTGESFEVSVPDGLKIYEYNSNWLDSVPYLVEHARWKKPWAYEALAECYRYGKGGVEKSMFNAIMSYEEAGMSATKVAEEAFESDPSDELGLINHLMEGLSKKSLTEEQVVSMIDNMLTPIPSWASLLKEILQNSSDDRISFIKSQLSNERFLSDLDVSQCMTQRHSIKCLQVLPMIICVISGFMEKNCLPYMMSLVKGYGENTSMKMARNI